MTSFKRTAAITGGTTGIGRAIVDAFLSAGYQVAACARGAQPKNLPRQVLYHSMDVRDRASHQMFMQAIKKRFGRLDVLVTCAGSSGWRSLEAIDEGFVEDILEPHVRGTLWASASALSLLKRGGSIVHVSSLAGKRGSARNSVYCAAKFAVNGITQASAKELGPRGIRVNAVCPVYVKTPYILEALKEASAPASGQPVAKYLSEFARTQTALGRLPTTAEVAQTVLFLAGPGASAITGQCLNVDCGTLPQ